MAERLRRPRGSGSAPAPDSGVGTGTDGATPPRSSGPAGNLTKEVFSAHFLEAQREQKNVADATKAAADAKAVLKGVYGRAKAAGIDIADLKWALDQAKLGDHERAAQHERRTQYAAFMGMPLGYQSGMDFAARSAEAEMQPEDMSEIQRERILDAGRGAGRAGDPADKNPWPLDSYAAQVWREGWGDGQAAKVHADLGDGAGATA